MSTLDTEPTTPGQTCSDGCGCKSESLASANPRLRRWAWWLTALSLVVMPSIAWAKRRVAQGLESIALKADAAETQLCTYLSAVVLIGLGANSLLGWWWMDPVAGLVVAALAVREGWEAWTSGELCEC